MAELNNAAPTGIKKIRSRKLNSKVDLTAMVDLAFLLITFFMLTTSLSKPKSMDLTMPETNGPSMPVDENRTMTILVGDDNKTKCYMGKQPEASKEIALGTSALRRELAVRKKQVLAIPQPKETPKKDLSY